MKKIPTNVVLQNNGKRLWKFNRIEGYSDCDSKTNDWFPNLQACEAISYSQRIYTIF
ncbi:MAG: hypothetical protein ACMG51_01055 [Ginsengibacter sp.]